jgi:hypothetical protein
MGFIQLFPEVRLIRNLDTSRDKHADEDSEEDERALDCCPVSIFFILDGEGFEEKVEESVDEGVVERQAEDDGLAGEYEEWEGEVLFDNVLQGELFSVGGGVEGPISGCVAWLVSLGLLDGLGDAYVGDWLSFAVEPARNC